MLKFGLLNALYPHCLRYFFGDVCGEANLRDCPAVDARIAPPSHFKTTAPLLKFNDDEDNFLFCTAIHTNENVRLENVFSKANGGVGSAIAVVQRLRETTSKPSYVAGVGKINFNLDVL